MNSCMGDDLLTTERFAAFDCVVLRGLPGGGKSTLAALMVARHGFLHLEADQYSWLIVFIASFLRELLTRMQWWCGSHWLRCRWGVAWWLPTPMCGVGKWLRWWAQLGWLGAAFALLDARERGPMFTVSQRR